APSAANASAQGRPSRPPAPVSMTTWFANSMRDPFLVGVSGMAAFAFRSARQDSPEVHPAGDHQRAGHQGEREEDEQRRERRDRRVLPLFHVKEHLDEER